MERAYRSAFRKEGRGGKEKRRRGDREETRRTRTSSPSGPTDVDVVLVHVGNGVLEEAEAAD